MRKNTDPASIRQGGYQYYRIIAESDDKLCAICEAQADRIIPVMIAREGVNFPPFHPNCRCMAVGDDSANPNHDPWTAERITWEYIKGSDLTFFEKCELLEAIYGDFDENERKALAQNLARSYASDPEMAAVIEAFGNGAFATPVNPVPEGGADPRNDWPNYRSVDGGGYHGGRDIGAVAGTPIVSATAGKVVHVVSNRHPDNNKLQDHDHYGNHVIVELLDGSDARIIYAHMQKVDLPVKVGDIVEPGTTIGYVGSSGNSSYNHLHVEIRTKENNYNDYSLRKNPDPANYMPDMLP